jgi:hypothetical protein
MATMASRARRALVRAGIAVLPLVVLLVVAQPAAACAIVLPDGVTEEERFRKDLRRTYAAIVGRLIEVRPVGPQEEVFPNVPRADFLYRVERVYKGKRGLRRGRVVTVRSWRHEHMCGLPDRIGRRYGLLLHRRRGHPRWRADLFDWYSPRRLRAAFRG